MQRSRQACIYSIFGLLFDFRDVELRVGCYVAGYKLASLCLLRPFCCGIGPGERVLRVSTAAVRTIGFILLHCCNSAGSEIGKKSLYFYP